MNPARVDPQKLIPLVDQLARAIEDLLLTGLTTASDATRQTLYVAFQEAPRVGLLRLGSTLRGVIEELGRFMRNEPEFSRKRFIFFLNRSWLLSKGLSRALHEGDEKEFDRMVWTPPSETVAKVDVVALGVAKRVMRGASITFEFRLRTVGPAEGIPTGQKLSWSYTSQFKPFPGVLSDGYLALDPPKLRFKPKDFLKGHVMTIEQATVRLDERMGRITLDEKSQAKAGDKVTDWRQFYSWDLAAALDRIRSSKPSPFDVDVELQEEVVLDDWRLEAPRKGTDDQTVFPIWWRGIELDAVGPLGDEGKPLHTALEELRKKKTHPPLFGLLHYEKCRFMLQPLSVFGENGPDFLSVSLKEADTKTLVQKLYGKP